MSDALEALFEELEETAYRAVRYGRVAGFLSALKTVLLVSAILIMILYLTLRGWYFAAVAGTFFVASLAVDKLHSRQSEETGTDGDTVNRVRPPCGRDGKGDRGDGADTEKDNAELTMEALGAGSLADRLERLARVAVSAIRIEKGIKEMGQILRKGTIFVQFKCGDMRHLLWRLVNVLRGRRWVLLLRDYRYALVLYVLSRGGAMGRRRLVKLLYLVDRELCRRYGAAAFSWKLYRYGPTSRDVYNTLDDLEDMGLVESMASNDDLVYRAVASGEPRREIAEIADAVLETWRGRSFDELVEYVNSLGEVKTAWPGRKLLC